MFEAELAVTQARLQLRMAESDLAAFMLRTAARRGRRSQGTRRLGDGRRQFGAGEGRSAHDSVADLGRARFDYLPIGTNGGVRRRAGRDRRFAAGLCGRLAAGRHCLPRAERATGAGPQSEASRCDRAAAANAARSDARARSRLPGKVELIGRIADPQTGNLPVRVLVENPRGQLVVGETLAVTIVDSQPRERVGRARGGDQRLGRRPLLHVVRQGKAVLLHPRLGMQDGGWVEVLETDLQPGEPVIVEGGYNLPADTEVKVESGAAETESGKVP